MSICSINYLDFKCRTANPSMNTYIGRKGPSNGGGGFLANPYPSSNPARPRGDTALDKNAHTSITEKENPIQTTNHTSRLQTKKICTSSLQLQLQAEPEASNLPLLLLEKKSSRLQLVKGKGENTKSMSTSNPHTTSECFILV